MNQNKNRKNPNKEKNIKLNLNKNNKKKFALIIFNSQKGIIFSTDALLSFVIILFIILIFTINLSNIINSAEKELTKLELDQKAIFITDSLVKNQNLNNPLLGACIYDEEKKRVISNNLDYLMLKNSKELKIMEYFVESISINFLRTNQTEKITYLNEKTKECTSVKRFLLINNEKAIMEVKVCKENKNI